ncbi:hypothetical protein [Roseateles aquatilis]|nr:hypothetical protein [Roseateles aquatilis]
MIDLVSRPLPAIGRRFLATPRRTACWVAAALLSTSLAVSASTDARWPAPSARLYRIPAWALGDDSCSATLITPRVALTTYYCGGPAVLPGGSGRITFAQRSTGRSFEGRLVNDPQLQAAPPAGLLMIVFDQASEARAAVAAGRASPPAEAASQPLRSSGAPVASYRREARLLRDPTGARRDDRRAGTRVYAYGPRSVQWRSGTGPTVHLGYQLVAGDGQLQRVGAPADMPLTYRSLAYLRSSEPGRFLTTARPWASGDDLLGVATTLALGGRDAAAADEWLLPLVGSAADGITRHALPSPTPQRPTVEPPFVRADSGAGLMATRPRPSDEFYVPGALVGLSTAPGHLHIRLVRHWPDVHRVMLAEGLRDDAAHLARRVLALKTWEQGGRGVPGDVYGRRDAVTGEQRFYRLRALSADGTYWSLPDDDADNVWWESLGTALPTRHEVLNWRPPGAFPSTAPSMPATDSAEGPESAGTNESGHGVQS